MPTKTTKRSAAKTARPKAAALKSARPKTVDEYLAAAPADQRAALRKIRNAIKAAAPQAIESVSYGIVGFKHNGQRLIYLGYWQDHLSLYGFSSSFADAHAAELEAYDLDKGTLRFTPERTLPDRLVTKIVKGRLAEIERSR